MDIVYRLYFLGMIQAEKEGVLLRDFESRKALALLGYGALVWLLVHAFVVLYEEPTLGRKYGASYEQYRAHVRRWRPRFEPWRGSCRG